MANQKLNVEITATDRASAKIEAAGKEADRLDGKNVDVKVDADTSGIEDALEALDVPISGLSGKLGGLGSKGGAVAGIAAGLLAAADYAADLAIEADNIAGLTGDSVETASQLQAVWKQTGADTKDLQDVLLQMNGVLKTTPELSSKIGLKDGATIIENFVQVTKYLDGITDATERSQIASQLFGEEGVRQYNALKQSVGDVQTAMENVPDGLVISDEDVERAREAKAQIAELKAEFTAFAAALGSVVVPAVGAVFEGLNDLFEKSREVGEGIRGLFDQGAADNFEIVGALEDAEAAAAAFDTQLLDGLTSFDQVRAKVLELTGSQHAANLVALEWQETNKLAAGQTLEQKEALDKTARMYGEYAKAATEAIGDEVEAQEDLIDSTGRLTDEYNAQRQAADQLRSAKIQLVGGEIAVREAQRQARVAAKDLDEELGNLEQGTDDYQAAVDEAALAQLGAAQQAADYRLAQMEANGSVVDAQTKAFLMKEELLKLAAGMTGPLRDAILGFIADLDKIPASKTVNIQVTSGGGKVNTGGGLAIGGGVKMAEGGIIPARPGGTHVIAGEAGMDEAFIPLKNGKIPVAGGGGGLTVVFVGEVIDGQAARWMIGKLEAGVRSGLIPSSTLKRAFGGG